MVKNKVPLLRPTVPSSSEILPYLQKVDAAAIYTNFGPLNESLIERINAEQKSKFSNAAYSITTSSGTLALELLISALNLKPGSRILLPALTFIATASAILRCGHIPVVADVDPHSWLLTTNSLDPAINLKKIGAVIPVTTFGMPVDIGAWSSWQKVTGIPVIIDAAGAFGGQSISKNISAIFSLHATKSFSTGEGGLIMTEHADLAKKLKKMSNFGIGTKASTQGTNAKLSEYHAAVGHASLNSFNMIAQKRRDLFDSYRKRLQENFGNALSFQTNTGVFAPSIFNIKFKNQTQRAHAEKEFSNNLIETRRWYQPLIQNHPDLAGIEAPVEMPHALELEKTVLGLPFFLGMTKQDQDRIIRCLKRAIGGTVHK